MRVIGIDPGTVSVDLCGLDEGRVFLDRSLPTPEALANPSVLLGLLDSAAPLDLVAGPSGYGLPLTAAQDLTDNDLRLAYLAADGEPGGIGGLRALMRALARSAAPVVLTPGVVHLTSVPDHRKVNRVDMGTADKVCAAALAVREIAGRRGCAERDVSFILLELGGAFTAAVAVVGGRIVDGIGGSSGPLGLRAPGAFDGEVAFLAGTVTKQMLFGGGAATIAGTPGASGEDLAAADTPRGRIAWDAYLESAVKAVAALAVSAPHAGEVVLSGRVALVTGVRDDFERRLSALRGPEGPQTAAGARSAPVHVLEGFATEASHAAQGAALIAEGLAGGRSSALVETLGIREARGTVLDHLFVIEPAAARIRLGLE